MAKKKPAQRSNRPVANDNAEDKPEQTDPIMTTEPQAPKDPSTDIEGGDADEVLTTDTNEAGPKNEDLAVDEPAAKVVSKGTNRQDRIKDLYDKGMNYAELAEKFRMGVPEIESIIEEN
ncbi:MAG TPA: hypothetical protein VJ841_03570 [Candidatus Saccharimonadales bacterium]|nr:hypothetical protein [Candidatus Saccharimonadales bacterium]